MIVKIPLYLSFNVDLAESPNFRGELPFIIQWLTDDITNLELFNEDSVFMRRKSGGFEIHSASGDNGNIRLKDVRLLDEREYLELIRNIEI